MAQIKIEQLNFGSPIIQTYSICDEDLAKLKVLRFNEYSEEWAEFVLPNRNNPHSMPAHTYDVVIGPIANDKVSFQLWRY